MKIKYQLIRDVDGAFRLYFKKNRMFSSWKKVDYFYSEESAREKLSELKKFPRLLLEETEWMEL